MKSKSKTKTKFKFTLTKKEASKLYEDILCLESQYRGKMLQQLMDAIFNTQEK